MKKIYFVAVSLILFVIPIVQAQDTEIEFLHTFLPGTYQAIGRWPNSDESYNGKVVLQRKGNRFYVVRRINGKEVEGIGRIATVTADKIKILNVEFSQHGCDYKATYIINSDLDNYARMTGYLFIQNAETKRPGLEALFIDHQVSKPDLANDKVGKVFFGRNLAKPADEHTDRLYLKINDSKKLYFNRKHKGPVLENLDLDKDHIVKVYFDDKIGISWILNFSKIKTESVIIWRSAGSWRMEPLEKYSK